MNLEVSGKAHTEGSTRDTFCLWFYPTWSLLIILDAVSEAESQSTSKKCSPRSLKSFLYCLVRPNLPLFSPYEEDDVLSQVAKSYKAEVALGFSVVYLTS